MKGGGKIDKRFCVDRHWIEGSDRTRDLQWLYLQSNWENVELLSAFRNPSSDVQSLDPKAESSCTWAVWLWGSVSPSLEVKARRGQRKRNDSVEFTAYSIVTNLFLHTTSLITSKPKGQRPEPAQHAWLAEQHEQDSFKKQSCLLVFRGCKYLVLKVPIQRVQMRSQQLD